MKLNVIARYVTAPVMLVCLTGVFFRVSAQGAGEIRFLSIENAGGLILERPSADARPVGSFRASPAGRDTVAVAEETGEFFRVRFITAEGGVEDGWVRKTGRMSSFMVRPAYSLADRYAARPGFPSLQDRLKAVSEHGDWSVVMRLAIAEGIVVSGMTPEMVLMGFGEADEHMRYFTSSVSADQWTYFLDNGQDFRLAFRGGRLELFEDVVYHSAVETEKKLILERKEYFYPHRLTSLKIMLGGAILMVAGYNGIQHDKVLSISDTDYGASRLVKNNNTANWVMIGVGFAAQALGGYLFNYTPGIVFQTYPSFSHDNHSGTTMAGISIPLAFRK